MKEAFIVTGYDLRDPLVQSPVMAYQVRFAKPRQPPRFDIQGDASQERS